MKDSHRVTRHTVEFNKLAARTDWNEPALRDRFFRGLPLRLRTDLLRGGKPNSLAKMRQKAQKYDQAYWLMKDEAAKSTPPTSSASKDKSSAHSDKKPFHSSSGQSSSRSDSRPNASSSSSKSGSSTTFKKDLSDKLGKDGKLRTDERKRRVEKNLCLYCGAGGHSAKDCRKAASTKGCAAQPVASSISQPASDPSDPKK